MNYNQIGSKCLVKTKYLAPIIFLFIALILGGLFIVTPARAQDVKADKVLKDTLIKSVSYKVYQGARGGRYIVRTSAKGNVYKQYIKAK